MFLVKKLVQAKNRLVFNGAFPPMDRNQSRATQFERPRRAACAALNRVHPGLAAIHARDHSKIANLSMSIVLYLRVSCSTICFSELQSDVL